MQKTMGPDGSPEGAYVVSVDRSRCLYIYCDGVSKLLLAPPKANACMQRYCAALACIITNARHGR